jgi:hypothetical protein
VLFPNFVVAGGVKTTPGQKDWIFFVKKRIIIVASEFVRRYILQSAPELAITRVWASFYRLAARAGRMRRATETPARQL